MTNKGDATVKLHMQKTQLCFSREKKVWYTKMAGIGTQCGSNSINKETFNEFHAFYKKYPENCCKNCAKSYIEMMKKGGKL